MENYALTEHRTATKLRPTMERLTALSLKRKSNPFIDIVWPESVPDDTLWMPHELMTVYGTAVGATLNE